MENIQNIKDYVEKTEIKKSFFGGYNKADVHKLLDSVLEMFETTLKEQQEKEEKRAADFLVEMNMIKEDAAEKSKMADELIVDLNKTIASLTDDVEKAEEKAKAADEMIVDLNKTIASLTDDNEKAEEKMTNIKKELSNLLEMIGE